MKQWGILFGVLAAIAVVFWMKRPLPVGCITTLSGPHSTMGISGRNGARLAVEAINRSGGVQGRRVELHVADNKENIDTAVTETKRLHNEGVEVIFGHLMSRMAPAITAFSDEDDLLFISPIMATSVLSIYDDNFIRFNNLVSLQADYLVDIARRNSQWKRYAAIYDERNMLFSQDIVGTFADKIPQGRVLDPVVSFSSSEETHLTERLLDIALDSVDAIFISAVDLDFALIAQLLRKNGFQGQLLAALQSY